MMPEFMHEDMEQEKRLRLTLGKAAKAESA